LKKYVESINDNDIANVEMPFGQISVYTVSPDGHKISESTVAIDAAPPNA